MDSFITLHLSHVHYMTHFSSLRTMKVKITAINIITPAIIIMFVGVNWIILFLTPRWLIFLGGLTFNIKCKKYATKKLSFNIYPLFRRPFLRRLEHLKIQRLQDSDQVEPDIVPALVS